MLIVRGEGGRDWLGQALRAEGATVRFVEAYRRTAPILDAAGQGVLAAACQSPEAHVWLFSSSEAISQLAQLAPQAQWLHATALATHPRIAASAVARGFGLVRLITPSPTAVAEAMQALAAGAQPPA